MPERLDEYADFIAYPYDLERTSLAELVKIAAYPGDSDIQKWRENFIGNNLDPEAILGAIS